MHHIGIAGHDSSSSHFKIGKDQYSKQLETLLAQAKLDGAIERLEKVGDAYHKEEYQDKARESLSMALWQELRDLKAKKQKLLSGEE